MNAATHAEDLLGRLRKVEGQVRSLQHLAVSPSDIDQLLTQIAAARGALHAVAVAALAAQLAEAASSTTDSTVLRRRLELVGR